MRLTLYTDYALRVMLYVGSHPDRLCSISEIATSYGISRNHLTKIVNDLARADYLASVRGRSGGIRLGRAPADINIGTLVRFAEDGFELVDCASCVIAPACGLTGVLGEALAAFMAVLDRHTLADLLDSSGSLERLFGRARVIA